MLVPKIPGRTRIAPKFLVAYFCLPTVFTIQVNFVIISHLFQGENGYKMVILSFAFCRKENIYNLTLRAAAIFASR